MSFSYLGAFPFCVYDGNDYGVDPVETGVGTIFPFGMSLEDAMAFYWKVKNFRFYGSYSFSFDYAFTDHATINDTFNSTVDSEFYWPDTMKEMICQDVSPFFYATTFGSGTIVTTRSSAVNTIPFAELDFFHPTYSGAPGSSAYLVYKGGLYYPKFYVAISTENEYGSYYSSVKPRSDYTTVKDMLSLIVNGSTYSTDFYAVGNAYIVGLNPRNLRFNGSLIVEEKDARLAQ